MRRKLARLARMGPAELAWRGRSAARMALDRARVSVTPPGWNRRALARRLSTNPAWSPARAALRGGRWDEAHGALVREIAGAAPRFVIAPRLKGELAARIHREFPASAADAAARADRVVSGDYDLLGYHGLRFARTPAAPTPDWHYDPVHDRRPPRRFWTSIPYLEADCGDHKIIWELNRHQHWLGLGRAFWLTGDPRYRQAFLDELASWLEANPPLIGVNWASMLELALRSISWIWALHFFAERPAGAATAGRDASAPGRDDPAWTLDLLLGLDVQLTQIERHLSYYFSPNTHLLGEGLALYVAGRTLPMLGASPRRARLGRSVLVREIGRQVALDGGHCERSTHYHRYALDFYLLALAVARITDDPVASEFERVVGRLAAAARLLADSDGRLPHFGDDDGGVLTPLTDRAPDDVRDSLAIAAALVGKPELRVSPAEETHWLLAATPKGAAPGTPTGAAGASSPVSGALLDTGYYVSRTDAGDHLVIDGGPHGFQNCGHAHADALSLTFARRSAPLLIDPGTGCYTIDPARRDWFRSTAMHNTLVIDGRSQSTPDGAFHWTRTARTEVRRWHSAPGFDYFDGAHDGYAPAIHRRHVLALHGDLLVVADLVQGAGAYRAAVHWHLDPRWSVELEGRCARLSNGADRVDLAVAAGRLEALRADAGSGLGWYSPAYGRVDPATTVRIAREGAGSTWIVSVFGLDARNPVLAVDAVPVWAEAGVLAESIGVRIARSDSVDYALVAEPGAPWDAGSRRLSQARSTRTWRVGGVETDARALLCRFRGGGSMTPLAIVDGTVVRPSGSRDGAPLPARPSISSRHTELLCVESPAS